MTTPPISSFDLLENFWKGAGCLTLRLRPFRVTTDHQRTYNLRCHRDESCWTNSVEKGFISNTPGIGKLVHATEYVFLLQMLSSSTGCDLVSNLSCLSHVFSIFGFLEG